MVRGILFQSVSVASAPLIVVLLAAGIALPPAPVKGSDVQVTGGSEPSSDRPIIALDGPRDEVASFMQFVVAAKSDSSEVSTVVRRALGAPAAKRPSSATIAAEMPLIPMRQLVVADADPYFERWQKDANERLKEEASMKMPKQHAFALANPDKMVIVCEAGCRTPKDEIVYIAAPVPAVEPPRQFDPTSSDAPAPVDEGNLPCIAGCYEKPERKKPAPRRAEIKDTTAPVAAASAAQPQLTATSRKIQPARLPVLMKSRHRQAGLNGAIVEQPASASRKIIRRAVQKPKSSKVTALRDWNAKVIPAEQSEPSVWKTKVVKQPDVLKRLKSTQRIRPAAHGAWRTKIVFEGTVTREVQR